MRFLLCGGGTAGHVMPAIAIAEIIQKNFPDSIIAFAGRKNGCENEAYNKTGHRLYEIEISGISRSLSINNIKTIIKVIKSGRIARSIIKDFNPDIIIGTGGYVCYPFIRQGQQLKIKTAIHESNVYPGLTTKLLSNRCEKVMLNLEGAKKYLRRTDNVVVVGNPIRSKFNVITKKESRKLLGISENQILIVSFGGSLGSEVLNKTICEFICRYTINNKSIVHIHSTGKAHFNNIKSEYPRLFSPLENVKILPYIENMPTVLTAADIAITRSGAMTISELCRSRTASILIPSPNVTANHQLINAEYMREAGTSTLIIEKELSPVSLKKEIFELIDNTDKIRSMADNAYRIHAKDTEKSIVNVINSILDDK